MNIGIKNSKSKKDKSIIIRADHSIYPEDYIFKCSQALFDSGGGNVGPIQRAIGTNFFTKVVADVMNLCMQWGELIIEKFDPLGQKNTL